MTVSADCLQNHYGFTLLKHCTAKVWVVLDRTNFYHLELDNLSADFQLECNTIAPDYTFRLSVCPASISATDQYTSSISSACH